MEQDSPAWARDAIVYHLFPLGLCGAPRRRAAHSGPPEPRLLRMLPWLEHARDLGATAVLLGPVWASSEHGYDTVDLRVVDPRLGTLQTLEAVIAHAHQLGLRVILDAVFNHVGRGHAVFQDVCARGAASPYCGWISGLRFDRGSPAGDPFTYDAWDGHYDLVKLDTANSLVRAELFDVVRFWVSRLGVDGLRLDAADVLSRSFQRSLARHCHGLRDDLWLMGEVVHGDYRRWTGPGRLHSVTNYEVHKALWSSHVDANYFELAHALERQAGLYGDLPMATFLDNHDVLRIASRLGHDPWLYTAHILLLTLPGIPTLYYGSEWGVEGRKAPDHDWDLRPALELAAPRAHPDLVHVVRRLAALRHRLPALRRGGYRGLSVAAEQLVFERETSGERVIVAVNAAAGPARVHIPAGGMDVLNDVPVRAGEIELSPHWGRVVRVGPSENIGSPS